MKTAWTLLQQSYRADETEVAAETGDDVEVHLGDTRVEGDTDDMAVDMGEVAVDMDDVAAETCDEDQLNDVFKKEYEDSLEFYVDFCSANWLYLFMFAKVCFVLSHTGNFSAAWQLTQLLVTGLHIRPMLITYDF